MKSSVMWLFIFTALYWAYCLFWGVKGYFRAKTASDYFIAGRTIPMWVFVLAATATSFSGWTFVGHPALVWRDGLQYAFASFYVITIPFTGTIFLKRVWMMGKRYGYITPGEMYSDYYGSEAMRWLTVIVALFYSVPYLGLQLRASGVLFNVLSDGMVRVELGMWALAVVVVLYVALGGLRSVAYVDTAQCILLMAGIIAIGIIAIVMVGGWGKFTDTLANFLNEDMAREARVEEVKAPSLGEDFQVQVSAEAASYAAGDSQAYSWIVSLAPKGSKIATELKGASSLDTARGVLQGADTATPSFTADKAGDYILINSKAVGSGKDMIIYQVSEGSGEGAAPSTRKSVNWFGQVIKTPQGQHKIVSIPGAIQWVPAGSKAIGGGWTGVMILTYMFALMGIQSSPAFTMWGFSNTNPRPFAPQQVWASSVGVGLCLFIFTALQGLGGWVLIRQAIDGTLVGNFLPTLLGGGNQSAIVPALINLMADAAPLLVGILAVCALAAMQSTGSAYMSTASGMITRDIYLRYINPQATAGQQKLWGRIWVVGVAFAALMVATFSTDALVMLGGLAVSFGTQMWIPLAGNLYFPWLTRQGVVSGLTVGLIAVMLTYPFKWAFFVGIHKMLGIGAYPLTIHCAGWGIMLNALVTVVVSAVTQPDRKEAERRDGYHKFLAEHAGVPAEKAHLKTRGWVITIVWLLFAIGPFATLGNNFFFWDGGNPASWPGGMPPLWLWQIVWWLLGCYMMYFLAYKLEFSTHFGEIESLREDIQETYGEKGEIRLDVEEPGV